MNALPTSVHEAIERRCGPIRAVRAVGGGDVSAAARVEAGGEVLFVKWGTLDTARTYRAEAEGLSALSACDASLHVPVPLDCVVLQDDGVGYLVLPWIERGRPSPSDWRRFGRALAELHRADAPGAGYGWHADTWIGSKPQRGGWDPSWPRFFGEKRLEAQAETVRQRGAWDAAWDAPLARLVARLDQILPASPPRSLLHGDLWSGNALPMADGRFALIDPAVSVGDREADLAMCALFGGFAPDFYEGYHEAWPLAAGVDERRDVYQLFHLINHLTHGAGYRRPVEEVLRRYGG